MAHRFGLLMFNAEHDRTEFNGKSAPLDRYLMEQTYTRCTPKSRCLFFSNFQKATYCLLFHIGPRKPELFLTIDDHFIFAEFEEIDAKKSGKS